jgi:hypothetical protein
VKDRPGPKDSGSVAWEAPWRESQAVEPSDTMLSKRSVREAPGCKLNERRSSLVTRFFRWPRRSITSEGSKNRVAKSRVRRFSPAGYQRRQGANEDVETGEALEVRRRNPVEEIYTITVSGKGVGRHQGGGSDRGTDDGRAAKRARRDGSGPVGMTSVEVRQG